MSPGNAQEERLFHYLRAHYHCDHVFHPEEQVRAELNIGDRACADFLVLHAPPAVVQEVTIAESKGTDTHHALEQLGNTAAGAFEKYTGLRVVRLLIYVPRLTPTPVGASPGPGYTVTRADAAGLHPLNNALTENIVPAHPVVTLPGPWNRWSAAVGALPVYVVVG